MKNILVLTLFLALACFLSPLAKATDQDQVTAQQEVLIRLMANASKKPIGPVENDLPSSVVKATAALLKNLGDSRPINEALAGDYSSFTLEGPLTLLYANAKAALISAPIKLTDATLHSPDIPLNADGGPAFGINVGGSMYLTGKLNTDGHAVGSFCFVLENGAWKVHNYYISNSPLNDGQKKFIIQQLDIYFGKS